ncbi:glycosyltransferase family 2 protein [Hyphomicrobium facile]|uniref:Glycosyltransferase, GT2 family n=1 Tax=Hyphomicrobium facile TaxID=51670 RepID=A0A1I7N666_9HYPH|nr:glycosyltransferase [Hyphomicrobium facile]SFV30152.1 Glycosyltransferase, GT2 family [Hyphomicrobium facile]
MPDPVSVCIPTFERPQLLKAAIHSCVTQAYRPLRIIVGDDSRTTETSEMLKALALPDGVSIEYLPRAAVASQRDNIIRLFNHVTTPYVSLLHDDDMFTPGGMDLTIKAAYESPSAIGAFGVQQIIDSSGALLAAETEQFNKTYLRTEEFLDRIHSVWFSVLSLQLPSNGFLLRTDLAKRAATALPANPGSAVDVAFALRLAELSGDASLFLTSSVTHRYRLTPGAETERLDHLPIYAFLREVNVPAAYRDLQRQRLAIFLVAAINERLSRGDVKAARELVLSDDYPAARRLQPMGIFHTAAAHLRLPPSIVRLPYAISRKRRFAHQTAVKA